MANSVRTLLVVLVALGMAGCFYVGTFMGPRMNTFTMRVRPFDPPYLQPWLKMGKPGRLYVHDNGWLVRCMKVDDYLGVVEPNYDDPECTKEHRILKPFNFDEYRKEREQAYAKEHAQ